MATIIHLIKAFFGGAACCSLIPLIIFIFKNLSEFKKENMTPTKEILMWVVMAFLVGGAIGAACFG